jgi:hypothetical protein
MAGRATREEHLPLRTVSVVFVPCAAPDSAGTDI